MKVLEIHVHRNATGAYLNLKSDYSWAFLHHPTGLPATVGGVRVYSIRTDLEMRDAPNARITSLTLTNSPTNKLFHGELIDVNLTFLCASNLRDVTFKLSSTPMSAGALKQFNADFAAAAQHLYRKYLKAAK